MSKTKILIVFGIRPEAIKMAAVIKEFQACSNEFEIEVCVTAQYREMPDQVLDFFDIAPGYHVRYHVAESTS